MIDDKDIRYCLCKCGCILSIEILCSSIGFRINDLQVTSFHSKYTKRKRKYVTFPITNMYVFCIKCDSKHKISTFIS